MTRNLEFEVWLTPGLDRSKPEPEGFLVVVPDLISIKDMP